MNKEVDTYKIFRELEAREKRKNPYKFYDKDELIDEILKNEDEIERLNNIIVKLKKVLWQRCEEARKNEQYVRLNCYKDILNELVNTIYEVDGETNE